MAQASQKPTDKVATKEPAKSETIRYAFVLLPRFNMLALTSTLEPLRIANYLAGYQVYEWEFLSIDGGNVTSSNAMPLATNALPEAVANQYNTIFVCSSWGSEHFENRTLFSWLRLHDRKGTHLGSIDLGNYILAHVGLLNGYKVAVLWYCLHAFSEAFPDVEASEQLFITDRKRTTIAGGIAGMDMMLTEIKTRHGSRLAHEVADHLLHPPVRQPDSPQRNALGGQGEVIHPVLRKAIRLMENHVEDPITIPKIAQEVGISQRKMERLFHKHIGHSAIGYYRILRLQFARVLLTNTELSIREISVACGYSSLSHFAKSFAEQFGKRPRDCRDAWPDTDPAPVWPGLSASLSNLKSNQL